MYIKSIANNTEDFLDKLKINLTDNNWELLSDRVATTRELYFRNLTSLVIIAFKVETDNLTYSNLLLNNILSFNSANSFYNQSGSISTSSSSSEFPMICLSSNLPMNYYLFINDNRIILTVNISNVYNTCYIGKLDSVVNPAVYPNPIFVGGHASSRTQLISDTDTHNTVFLFSAGTSNSEGRPKLRKSDNSWSVVSSQTNNNYSFFYPPYYTNNNEYYRNYNTTELEKVLIYLPEGPAGYLDGIYKIFGNNLSACSEFEIDSEDYIIFPNVFRALQKTHFAIKKV